MSKLKWGLAIAAFVTVAVVAGGKKKKKKTPTGAPSAQGPIRQVGLSPEHKVMFEEIERTSSTFSDLAGSYQAAGGAGAQAGAAIAAAQTKSALGDTRDVLVAFYIDLKNDMKIELSPTGGE